MAFKNQLKTMLLLVLLTALLLWVGSFWGQDGLIIAFGFAILMNFGSYWFSDKIILMMYKAKKVGMDDNAEFYRIVQELTMKMNIPMPNLYIIPTNNANAFATGRNPKHAAVACTAGIMELLSENELKGVIAHELNHIKHRDTLIATIAATIASVIGFVAMMARWGAMFGGYRNRDGGNLIELLALAILMPLIATIIRLAISRSREFLADEGAAKIIGEPSGLINALQKLHKDNRPLRFGSKATASLFIVNPFRGKSLFKLFSTHPPVETRIKKLKAMMF